MRGLIQGPEESQEKFLERVQNAKKESVIAVFGLEPDWIPIVYSNKKLAPWEAGCVWIEKERVHIQLRTKGGFLKLVSQEELLKHEAVHAMRMAFDEPRFEEVLAYQTSSSRFRRALGPFFRTPRESWLFFAATLLAPLALPFLALLTGITAYACGRLWRTQRTFARAKRNVAKLTDKPLALLLHLKDKEIELFAKSTPDEIRSYLSQQKARLGQAASLLTPSLQ